MRSALSNPPGHASLQASSSPRPLVLVLQWIEHEEKNKNEIAQP
jgi:hypothetical protein